MESKPGFSLLDDPLERRDFFRLMGASLALASFPGCMKMPVEKIIPAVIPSEGTLGEARFFATAFLQDGYSKGVLVESHEGRPTKIEGNPDHPASLGGTDVFMQASILSLYDPDRLKAPLYNKRSCTWDDLLKSLIERQEIWKSKDGNGVRILTEAITSPTQISLMREFLDLYPKARWHQYQPFNRDEERAGALMAFGEDVQPRLRIDRSEVIVSLDADFLVFGPASVSNARKFADGRRIRKNQNRMSRLYVAEASPTLAGANADHRLAVKPSQVLVVTIALAERFGLSPGKISLAPELRTWVDAVVKELQAHHGSSLIIAGDQQPALVHALAFALNTRLGNLGKTLELASPVAPSGEGDGGSGLASLTRLIDEIRTGVVEDLFILGGNPVYTAPADLRFGEFLAKVPRKYRLSLFCDETAEKCDWVIPETHFLEAWGDARAFDGTASVLQPLISPLYSSKSAVELLSALLGRPGYSGYQLVRNYWRMEESDWKSALNQGLIPVTAFETKVPELRNFEIPPPRAAAGLEVSFRPDPTIYDGTYANNAWLQELPKPLTKLTWGNGAHVSPETAKKLSLKQEALVEIRLHGRVLELPVLVVPGHPDDSVTIHAGFGRTAAGVVGNGVGGNIFSIQSSGARYQDSGLEIRNLGKSFPLAITSTHYRMEGRFPVRYGTLSDFKDDPAKIVPPRPPVESIVPKIEYKQNAWGMVIDLNTCIGCNACMTACQAENNIPVVGKEQVRNERAMHWIRVDRYYTGSKDSPNTYFQPLPCMHCETAPCELVCPTEATNHDDDGLNLMVYNRCVGTRYCSNNCPYKVRRFNFLQYNDLKDKLSMLQKNPEVTVRSRGVMEKCSYCIQRIRRVQIQSEIEDRSIRDGEVVPACAQACPTRAISFGDLNDPDSQVKRLRGEPVHYLVLEELNTRPRTSYLAKVNNLNPDLKRELEND